MLTKKIHEDWIAVIIAFLAIAAITLGLKPFYGTDILTKTGSGFIWVAISLFIAKVLSQQRGSYLKLLPALAVVVFITLVAQLVANTAIMKAYGIEVVLFSLILGLIISNTVGVPGWLKPAIQTELYIKTGLVLLGCNVLFQDIVKAGALGIIQSVAVVFTVWYFSFWLCRKLGLDDEFRMMISSAVSICGVSAAIATAGGY